MLFCSCGSLCRGLPTKCVPFCIVIIMFSLRGQIWFRRRWARVVVPAMFVCWMCEVGWLFAFLNDLPWLALVFAFLASIGLTAAWFVAARMTQRGARDDDAAARDKDGDDEDDDFDAAAFVPPSAVEALRQRRQRDRGTNSVIEFVPEVETSPELIARNVSLNTDGDGDVDRIEAEPLADSTTIRRTSSAASHSSQNTMVSAASVADLSEEAQLSVASFVPNDDDRRTLFDRALVGRAWPLARIPCAVHLAVALLRVLINMQIVAVNQFVIMPQSAVYEAIVATGLSFFTLCVICLAAWQTDVIVAAICSLGMFSIAFGPRSCFDSTMCVDRDSVLISKTTVSLGGILALQTVISIATSAWSARSRRPQK